MPEPSLNPETGLFGKGVAVEDGAVQAGGQVLVFDVPPGGGDVTVEKAATKKLGLFGWIAVIWLFAVVFAAVFAPVLPIPEPDQHFLLHTSEGPSLAHPMGTDGTGQDLFARVIWGARASLVVAVSAVLFGLIFGGFFGLIAGYYRGKLDTVLVNTFNVFLAIPQLVLALALVAVFASDPAVSVGKREFWLIISIGLVSIPIIGRITRASALSWTQREFVLASRSMGAKNGRIMRRDVLPNVLPAMFSIALLGIAVVIVLEGGLSILGVGIPPSTPSWGNMIATGRNELTKVIGASPQVILAPSLAIFLTVLSLNYLGDVVRARFDVREAAI
jgi:peptide/nickel transport system permease protein